MEAIKAKLGDENAFRAKLFSHQAFCKQVVNLQPGQAAVITNGRVSLLLFGGGRGEIFFLFLLTIKRELNQQIIMDSVTYLGGIQNQ